MNQKKNKNTSITDILKGRFLVEDNSFQNWKFVLFLSLLAFISIIFSHIVDSKVVELATLKEEVSNLKSESSFLHKSLLQSKMESKVAEKVLSDSIKKSDTQPFLIIEK